MRTSITISGLQLYAFHGLFHEEQRLGQKFTFDVHAEVDAPGSHCDDDLSRSVRYDTLVEEVVRSAQAATYQTLEALAEQTARTLLARFPQLAWLAVSVAKLSPPIPHTLQQVAVRVEVAREQLGAG